MNNGVHSRIQGKEKAFDFDAAVDEYNTITERQASDNGLNAKTSKRKGRDKKKTKRK